MTSFEFSHGPAGGSRRPAPIADVSLVKALLIVPTTYGLVGWAAALLVLIFDPFKLVALQATTWVLVLYVFFVFLVSMAVSTRRARHALAANWQLRLRPSDTVAFWLSVVIGTAGLAIYVSDFSRYFGGLSSFISVLVTSSLDIRMASLDVTSGGFTISYLSWVAVFFGVFIGLRPGAGRAASITYLGISGVLFLGNLMFIDRTRPTWIFMVVALGVLFARAPDRIHLPRVLGFAAVVPVAIFFLFALTSGKYDQQSGVIYSFVTYIIGGLAYLDSIITEITSGGVTLLRTFLPISKVLEVAGVVRDVPKEVLEFRYVPFPNNTGTFLQPLFQDGGFAFVLVGAPLICLLTDQIALKAFERQSAMGRFIWGNLCFSMMISFFVPKFNTVAIYLFAALYIIDNVAVPARPSAIGSPDDHRPDAAAPGRGRRFA